MKNTVPMSVSDFLSSTTILHDAVCENWTFDYSHKQLILFFQSADGEKHRMVYHDVYAHQMMTCDFWGPSPHIYGCHVVEKESGLLYKQLVQTIAHENCDESFIRELADNVETEMQFISGDVLLVLCKSISIE